MTFQSYEQSNANARPVSFYKLTWGNTTWSYCNADRNLTLEAVEHEKAAISEGNLKSGGEYPELTLTVPLSLPVVDLFRGTPPSRRVTLTIRSMHPDDPDAEAIYRWIGPITNVRPLNTAEAEIVSRISGLDRTGLRQSYGRGCKYALYGRGCEVVKSLFAAPRTITAVSGNAITVDAVTPSEGYFNGGLLEWDADGLGTIESRTIERETGTDSFVLYGRGDGLSVAQAVTLYPGCARNATVCNDTFNNLPNYPGLDFMLGESPFDGRSLV